MTSPSFMVIFSLKKGDTLRELIKYGSLEKMVLFVALTICKTTKKNHYFGHTDSIKLVACSTDKG
jgi:hypothetical protein